MANIKPTGRNLLLDTVSYKSWHHKDNSVEKSFSLDTDGLAVITLGDQDNLSWEGMIADGDENYHRYSVFRNRTITLSGYFRADETDTSTGNTRLVVAFSLCKSGNSRFIYHTEYLGDKPFSKEWERRSITCLINDEFFDQRDAGATEKPIEPETDYLLFQFYRYNKKGCQMKGLKVEIGDVATDYRPAPEDHIGRNLILDSKEERSKKNGIIEYDLSSYLLSTIEVGKKYTVSFNARSDEDDTVIDLYIRALNASQTGTITTTRQTVTIGTDYKRYAYTVEVERLQDLDLRSLTLRSNTEIEGGSATATVTFDNVKLEEGDTATPWIPAQEDGISAGGGVTNMILAFDVISLATVTDVQGIYRFYQLGTSMPSKPTVYPPPSPWVQTMPSYQLGNQDNLYFIDVTLFSDLTFQYGEVQLSTDYDAVKATYQDALNQIANAEKQMQSDISKSSEEIRTEVSEQYYKKDQTDDLLGTISTALEQTKDMFEMQFTNFQADLTNINEDNTAKFQELYQYIRFKGGSIELGESGNTITLTIENDRISFKQSGQEIAYMSNNQLYITDANIVISLRIGDFIFSPRPDKSLDFKKAGA